MADELDNVMPSHEEALEKARRYLDEAATLLDGSNLGAIFANTAFLLYSSEYADGRFDESSILKNCRKSAKLLSREGGDFLACMRLLWMLISFGDSTEVEARFPIDRWHCITAVGHYGMHLGVAAHNTMIRVLLGVGGAEEVPSLVDEVRGADLVEGEAFAAHAPIASRLRETDRRFLELARIHALPGDPGSCSEYRRIGDLAAFLDRAKQELWRPDQIARAVPHALLHTPKLGSEGAIEIIASAEVPNLIEHLPAVAADVSICLAADAIDRDSPADALRYLNVGLDSYLGMGYKDIPSALIRAMHWILLEKSFYDIERIGGNLSQETFNLLLKVSDKAYRHLGETSRGFLRRSWVHILAALSLEQRCGADELIRIMQALKGRPLSIALAAPGPLQETTQQRSLLAEMDRLERADSGHLASEADNATRSLAGIPMVDQEGVLTSFMSEREFQHGKSPVEMLRNMRREYQRLDARQLVSPAVPPVSGGKSLGFPYRSSGEVSQALPDTTLLASLCFGVVALRSPDTGALRRKANGFFALLCGRSEKLLMSVHDPDDIAFFDTHVLSLPSGRAEGREMLHISPFGLRVAALRRTILEDPMHRRVGREAAKALKGMASYFSPLLNHLEDLDVERFKHLCFWPQWELYFLPFHLLPWRDGIIADHFTVTLIPSLEAIVVPRHDVEDRRFLVVACADGGVEYGLHSEPSLHVQAESISSTTGARMLIGDDATPSDVCAFMQSSHYIHIAAHGAQNVDAPAFHSLFLSRADGSRGRLCSHHIAKCDLRGVQLVTLSACESALLRFDVNDNLFGIASAFLRAGARAVLGALWPVKAEVADLFFRVLYSDIAAGRDKLASYSRAQLVTRRTYPEYRDWAAFSFLGDWR
ncbi:CHAT domain-containing protein [Streptomyces nigrescens]